MGGKKLVTAAILCAFAVSFSGCATYQLHKPIDGSRFIALSDNVKELMIDAQLVANPDMTREEAEAMARDAFLANQPEIMREYRRVSAAHSLLSRIAAILRGEPIPELGLDWDAEQMVKDIDAGLDLSDMFSEKELDVIGVEFPETEEPPEAQMDAAEQLQEKWQVKDGDVWQIGGHRLMCGDATIGKEYKSLLLDCREPFVFTDPPYGINIVKGGMVGADFGIAKKGKYSAVTSDETIDAAAKFYTTCVSLGFERFVLWGGNYFTDFLPFSDGWLVWDKRGESGIRNTFADGEMAWCSFHTPLRIYTQLWNGMIREGERSKRIHPTQKPVSMIKNCISDHAGDAPILDPFLGSGTTMVAAEQLGRKCYGMEIEPKYCAVILERMSDMGLEPELIENVREA